MSFWFEISTSNLALIYEPSLVNPEVSWVRPLLEGMEGFSSPFESLRTILWYWSHFSVGLYEVKYNPTEKQLVVNLVVLTFIKKSCSRQGSNPGLWIKKPTLYQLSYPSLVEKIGIFCIFKSKTVPRTRFLATRRAVGTVSAWRAIFLKIRGGGASVVVKGA